MVTVANPVYDTVFKYLMEDERIARTILSALLKKDVVQVAIRRNEYTNQRHKDLSIFRIDFGATIRDADGREHLILIEVQKTWVETETLRFRQYLGAQYANKENMVHGRRKQFALPMMAVYLLGHKVGDIEEPVIYVRNNTYDYNGNVVSKGMPDPFVTSLTHNSIIVQIPRLHGQINNRLDKVLSIFDQSHKEKGNEHMLNIDETVYSGDSDMQHIVHRLTEAAASTEMRRDMEVEDELFSVLESRETEIMMLEKELAEAEGAQKEANAEKEKAYAEKEKANAEKEEAYEKWHRATQEKERATQEREEVLRRSVAAMRKLSMQPEDIANALGLDIKTVKLYS